MRKAKRGLARRRQREHRRQGDRAADASHRHRQAAAQRRLRGTATVQPRVRPAHRERHPDPQQPQRGQRQGDQQHRLRQPPRRQRIGAHQRQGALDDLRQLQSEQQEDDAVEQEADHRPDDLMAHANLRADAADAGTVERDPGGDHGEDAGRVGPLGRKVGGERQHRDQGDVGRRRIERAPRQQGRGLAGQPAQCDPRADAAGHHDDEGAGRAEHREAAAHRRKNGKPETDQSGGIVEQRLAGQDMQEASRCGAALEDGAHRDRIGGRQHGRQREACRERHVGFQPMDEPAAGERAEQHQPEGKGQDHAAECAQRPHRHLVGVGEQQWRDEQQHEHVRLQPKPKAGEVDQHPDGDLQQRQRDADGPGDQAAQRGGGEQQQGDQGDVHPVQASAIARLRRAPGSRRRSPCRIFSFTTA